MGYEAPTSTFLLRFEDHPGLEVRARSVPLGVFTQLASLADVVEHKDDHDLAALASGLGELGTLFDNFGDALVEWNVTINGQSVPATPDGVRRLDVPFALELIFAWMDAIGGVEAPLARRSPGGGHALAGSLPMEPLSGSQAS